jgi:hypothetical protein
MDTGSHIQAFRDSLQHWPYDTPATDVAAHPIWVLGVVSTVALIIITVVIAAKLSSHKPKVITDDPASLFHYLADTIRKHWCAYLVFSGLPLLFGIVFKINVLNIFGIWGFLVTSLSAFYATKADVSAGKARTASEDALNEAKRTYNAVVEFADSLEMFNDNVRYRLEEIAKRDERISVKFLTVIPAFGAVGLDKIYEKRRLNGQIYSDFPRFLCKLVQDQVAKNKFWNVEFLTHNHAHVKLWLKNIYEASESDQNDRTVKIDVKYAEQKEFVKEFSDNLVIPHYRRMRFWEPRQDTLPNFDQLQQGGSNGLKIPFQFLLVKRYVDFDKEDEVPRTVDDFNTVLLQDLLRVFFLFSGDFLYDFVFKVLQGKVDMSRLQQLTKGYYSDDPELLKVFNNIFWSFSKKMPCLTEANYQVYFP